MGRERYRDDRRLTRRMLAGDEKAFDRFCSDCIPVLYRFARRRLVGNEDLVGDLVQTALCKTIAKLDTYRGEAALTTWLCTCLRNEIAGHFRKRSSRGPEVDLVDDDELPSDASFKPVISHDPEQTFLRSEDAALVHEALDRLPPHYGKALEWKYLENLPVREIARRLELSPKAAESLLTRARLSFREEYSRFRIDQRLSPDAA